MNKKQIVLLLIVTNLISIGIVISLFLTLNRHEQTSNTAVQAPQKEPNETVKIQTTEPKTTLAADVNSILAQYDVIKGERYKQITEAYGKAIRMEPPYTAKVNTQARHFAETGNFEKAIEAGKQDIKDSPFWPDNYYALAWVYAKTGQYDKAKEVCQEAIKSLPDYSKIWHILGWIDAKTGDMNRAISDCNQVLKLDPVSAQTYYALGRIYAILGRNTEAVDAYNKAIQLQPDWAEAHLFLGLTYAELGKRDEAIKAYKDAVFIDRHYPEGFMFLGIAYDESNQSRKAIESFERAIDEYYAAGNAERIRVLGIKPDLTNIYCAIGVCHLKLGEPRAASLAFQKVIEINNDFAGAHYGLALSSLLLGDKKTALAEYNAFKSLKGEAAAKPLLDVINKASQ